MLVVIGSEPQLRPLCHGKIINNNKYKQEGFVGLEHPEIGLYVDLYVCNTVMA